MKLKYKLFIALISTSCLILILVVGVMQFTVRKNFIGFLNDVEFGKQTRMVDQLKENYTRHAGWDGFKGNPLAWHLLLGQARPDHPPTQLTPPLALGDHAAGPPPNGPAGFHRRLCLFDAQKNYVAGECRPNSRFDFYPIEVSDQTVGFLGLENTHQMRQPLELAFLKKQTQAIYLIAVSILGLCFLVSFLIARQVLEPVKALAKGTQKMRNFNFDAQVKVTTKDELGDLARDFNRMAATLKQYETLRKNWISDISHELRTPVAVIRSKIEALQDGIRESTPQFLDTLHKDILGLGKLINDLHQISLMDSQNLAVNLAPVCLENVLNKSLEAFVIRFEKKQIDIQKMWPPAPLPKIQGDGALLMRVFANLLENTLKYTHSPGGLQIHCRVTPHTLVIKMEDSAPGVPKDCLERIFGRLYRMEQSRNRILGGSGLGLSMSREIISLHQGSIRALESDLGGLKIVIELPLATEHVNS